MTQPKTLLEMAGAAPASVDPADAAVVMIDCQREYLDGHLPLVGVEAALAEGARLVAAARSRGIPVFHVQHRGRPGGLFDPEGPSFAIVDAVATRELPLIRLEQRRRTLEELFRRERDAVEGEPLGVV